MLPRNMVGTVNNRFYSWMQHHLIAFLAYFTVTMASSMPLSKIVYNYGSQCLKGILLRRYKRFLADVEIDNAPAVTVHCPNTGSMLGLISPDSACECFCSMAKDDSKRKYNYTLEMIRCGDAWVGIHSSLANKIVDNAFRQNLVEEYTNVSIQREVKWGGDSRIDFQLKWNKNGNKNNENDIETALVEVKSTTMSVKRTHPNGHSFLSAEFPDTVSERAQKHLKHLTEVVRKGGNAAILFLIQRDDCESFSASDCDREYGLLLSEAVAAGVQVLPYHCRLEPETGTIHWLGRIPFNDMYAGMGKGGDNKSPKIPPGATKRKRLAK